MTNQIDTYFARYADLNNNYSDKANAPAGFVTWAWDSLLETITQLGMKSYEQLAADIVYAMAQSEVAISEADATAWLDDRREELGEALTEAID